MKAEAKLSFKKRFVMFFGNCRTCALKSYSRLSIKSIKQLFNKYFTSLDKITIMPYELNGIGGVALPTEESEPIAIISQNTTLIVINGTVDSPVKPEVIKGLTTIDQVFSHFAPVIGLEMETEEGTTQKETIGFKKLSDFGIDGISRQSHLLHDLTNKKEEYQKITTQLKKNKPLRQALADETTKQSFIQTLQALIEELDETA